MDKVNDNKCNLGSDNFPSFIQLYLVTMHCKMSHLNSVLVSAYLCTGKASKAFGHAVKSSVTRIADRSSPFMSDVVNLCACLINMYNFKILKFILTLFYVYILLFAWNVFTLFCSF